jgi:lipopolysaccharide export LptBFGC system permease protein LptF
MAAAARLGPYGWLPQVFQSELLYRFSDPLFFLPLSILVIAVGWRYRARKRSLYLGIPMLGILPVVFNGAVYYYRELLSNLGDWAVITLGFLPAIYLFAGTIIFLFLASLIILASQHGEAAR